MKRLLIIAFILFGCAAGQAPEVIAPPPIEINFTFIGCEQVDESTLKCKWEVEGNTTEFYVKLPDNDQK